MGTHALFAPILVAVSTTGYGDAAEQEDPVIFNLWPPVRVTPFLNPPPVLSSMPAMSVGRELCVSLSPQSPSPSDLMYVTISAEASSPDLMLNRTTVDKQGSEIAIDLYWSGSAPAEICADKEYEVTEPLGTFSPGLYKVHICSHGALEGEAFTLFNVRAAAPAAGGAFNLLHSLH
jgi:hypothetical protein